jgi:hypothetical protein
MTVARKWSGSTSVFTGVFLEEKLDLMSILRNVEKRRVGEIGNTMFVI